MSSYQVGPLHRTKPHLMRSHYQAEFDFPRRDSEPLLSYMLATIPRSGSTFLSMELWRTGCLGAPIEYLNLRDLADVIERLGAGDVVKYWKEVRRVRCSNNGVFGFKMFVPNYHIVSTSRQEFLREVSAEYTVYLVRRDKVAQAVSYARAIESGAWFAGVREHRVPEFEFESVRRCIKSIVDQEAAWERVFTLTATHPLRLTYEDARMDPQSAVEMVANLCGIRLDDDARLDVGHIAPQADEVSIRWIEAYQSECDKRNLKPIPCATPTLTQSLQLD